MGHGAVANDLEHPPAGQYIEADDGNSRRSKMLLADPHQGFAHRLGNPAVDAVTNDEVELPVGGAKLSEAARLNIDIGEAQVVYPSPAGRDLVCGDINPQKACLWKSRRKRNEVTAGGAAYFKGSRRLHLGHG